MTPSTSTQVIKELKSKLASLALNTIGQHLWSDKIAFGDRAPTRCMCNLCSEARKSYQFATGILPTSEQEQAAMQKWGSGEATSE